MFESVMSEVYSRVPDSEVRDRLDRLRVELNSAGLDGALLFSIQELYYYSGIGIPGVIFVPTIGEEIRLAERNVDLVKEYSTLDSVRPLGRQSKLFETLKIPQNSRIAMEGDILPLSFASFLQSKAQNIELVDGSSIFRSIRSRKSRYEIDLISEAANLVDRSFDHCREIVTPEMTEIELSSELDKWMVKNGHAGFITTRAFNSSMIIYSYVVSSEASTLNTFFTPISGQGLSLKYPFGPTRKKLGKNQPFLVDSCGNIQGYI
ncbi:MAG: aminopeptidase P family N-terminal domain-containing protein, partial [Candidatus Hodarchaeota archaeon]